MGIVIDIHMCRMLCLIQRKKDCNNIINKLYKIEMRSRKENSRKKNTHTFALVNF